MCAQDERNQQLRTNAWLQQTWTDPALCWTPSEYGNITSLHIPYEHVWKPDIVLYNK
jgi:nicotinic acetylcholine receptor